MNTERKWLYVPISHTHTRANFIEHRTEVGLIFVQRLNLVSKCLLHLKSIRINIAGFAQTTKTQTPLPTPTATTATETASSTALIPIE